MIVISIAIQKPKTRNKPNLPPLAPNLLFDHQLIQSEGLESLIIGQFLWFVLMFTTDTMGTELSLTVGHKIPQSCTSLKLVKNIKGSDLNKIAEWCLYISTKSFHV